MRERSVAGALLLQVLNFIGLGLGPMFTGFVSDGVREYLVENGRENAKATADGLRWAIRITVLFNAWSAVHYWLAARTLVQDIAQGERELAAAA